MNHDIERLGGHILTLIKASKHHTTTEMVMGDIPIATLYNFNYAITDNPFGITSSTLKKVALRLDELEPNQHYYEDLRKLTAHFIDTYIMVDSVHELTKIGLNYTTLKKIENRQLDIPYRMETLIKYAKTIQQTSERGMSGANR